MNLVRSIAVFALLFFGVVFTLTANATVWANRTVFDTENFVETANRTLDDEDVQEQLATRLSVRLVERSRLQENLTEELPERLRFLAPTITQQVLELAHNIVIRALNNDRLRDALDASLRLTHQQVLKIIEDEGAVVVEEDTVVLDLGVIVEQAAADLGIAQEIELNVDEDAGQIVLVEDAETADAVQNILSLHDTITWVVIALAVLAFAAAVLVARNRRATLRTVGILLIITGLLAMAAIVPIRPIANAFTENEQATNAAIEAFTLDYRIQSFMLVLLGALVLVVAIALGDGELARAARRSLRRPAGEPAPDWGHAFRANATALRATGLITGAIVLVGWPEPTTRVYVTTFVLLALYFVGLWIMTSNRDLAANIRGQVSGAVGNGDPAGGNQGANATFFGRYATQIRIAGIGLVLLVLLLLPDLGWGAVAVGVMIALVFLALVDFLATRSSE